MTGLQPDEPAHGPGGARGRAGRAHVRGAPAQSPSCAAEARRRPIDHARSTKVRTDIPIPPAPYLERKVRDVPHLAEVWSYINPFMLYGRHLGYKGNFEKALAEHEPKALELFHNVEEVKQEAAQLHEGEGGLAVLRSRARRQLHPPVRARRRRRPSTRSTSAASAREDGLCLSDYILDADDGRRDHLALFVVTAGAGIRERAEEVEEGRRVLQGARPAGAGHRNRRRLRRMAAPPHPRRLGLPRSARP